MAARFWVGGTGTWDGVDTTHWSNSDGGAGGAAVPSSSDDVVFNANSGLGSGGTVTVAATAVCNNFTISGINSKTVIFSFSGNPTFSGIMSWAGNDQTTPILFQSNTVGTARTITCNGSHSGHQYIHFMDVTIAGSAGNVSGTRIGDCGGNTGVTFDAAVDRHWISASGGNWSDATKWTGGLLIPLPQDNVYFDNAFSASQTVTANQPRLGKSIDWTGATGTPTFSLSSLVTNNYGSITLISGMSVTHTQAHQFCGRGSFSITSAGKQFANIIRLIAPNGTYILNDAFVSSGGGGYVDINAGTLNTNDFNFTCWQFAMDATTITRAVYLGRSVLTINTTTLNTGFNASATNITVSAANATIVFSAASSNSRNFIGAGQVYGTVTYNVAGSTGKLVVSGSNTFTNINFSDASNARTLELTAGTTQTILNSFNVQGTSGKLMSVVSATAGTPATLSKASGIVSCDYLSIKDSIATGGAGWYAGANSTDGGNNSGWTFTAPPGASLTGKSAQEVLNQMYGSSGTQYSEQEIANIYNGTAQHSLSLQEVLNSRAGRGQHDMSEQEAIFANLKTALSLSGSDKQYSVQELCNLALNNSLTLSNVLG